MFEDLVTDLSSTLSVVSLLFFVAIYVVVTVRAFRGGAVDLDARARMALEDGTDGTRHGRTTARG